MKAKTASIALVATLLTGGTGAVASASTTQYMLLVPIKVVPLAAVPGTARAASSLANAREGLAPFLVSCALGGDSLAYAPGSPKADNAVGSGSKQYRPGKGSSIDVPVQVDSSQPAPTKYVCWATLSDVTDAPSFSVGGDVTR